MLCPVSLIWKFIINWRNTLAHQLTFHREIDKLKQKFMILGSLVEDRLRKACLAMKTRDKNLLEEIIGSDWEIDEMEVEIEEECLKILALHQPVARDLRLIIAVIKINNELERIADIAVNMSKRIMAIKKENNDIDKDSFNFDYRPMASLVQTMLKGCLDALVLEDPNRARKIFIEDEEVDNLRKKACKEIISMMEKSSKHANSLVNFYMLALHLERIGDRCTNIAEEIIYLIEGEIIRGERS